MNHSFMRIAERAAERSNQSHLDDMLTGYSNVTWFYGQPEPGFFVPFDEYMELTKQREAEKRNSEYVKALYRGEPTLD